MHSSRVAVAVLLAVCTPATGFTMGSVARHAVAPRASARMDEESKKRAEDALERAQQRAKAYAKEKRAKGPEINPNTYNVLYSAIIGLTLNDLRQNDAVTGWLAAGARLDAAPLQQLGASTARETPIQPAPSPSPEHSHSHSTAHSRSRSHSHSHSHSPEVLMAYALFQLLFSIGGAGTWLGLGLGLGDQTLATTSNASPDPNPNPNPNPNQPLP